MNKGETPVSNFHAYYGLGPDQILDAIEQLGIEVDSGLLALNSYENRVYQFRAGDGRRWVAKFYRPGRWSDAQILEEHQLALELVEAEVPVVAPWPDPEGRTLFRHQDFRYSLFPSVGGRQPDLNDERLEQFGRLLGRFHAISARQPFRQRPSLTVQSFGWDSLASLKASGRMDPNLAEPLLRLMTELLGLCERRWQACGRLAALRLHGDCHAGNGLWQEEQLWLVDLDDARQGPAIQDMWMLLSGDLQTQREQLYALLAGYEDFRSFDYRELALIEVLRSLRLIQYNAWLAQRWDDPAFPKAFPWFESPHHWQSLRHQLEEQLWLLQQTPDAMA